MARRRNRGRSRGNSSRGPSRTPSAWLVTDSQTGSTGVAASGVNWGGAAQTLAAGVTQSFQAVVLPEAVTAANAPPSLGECDVVGLDATIDISSVSAAGKYLVGLALYVSDYSNSATTWETKDACAADDAMDQDLLHVVAHAFQCPAASADTGPVSVQLRVMLPFAIRIGTGQALHVTLSNDTTSAGVLTFTPFVRAKIAHVA